MTININNYSQFYKSTETLKHYGNTTADTKDTLVKYEFNTKDAEGNKIMDKMSREETLQAMKDISSQYGSNVIVEFSGDGLAKLIDGKTGWADRPLSAEEEAIKAAKQAEFDNAVVQLENTHRIIIPNTRTNKLLYSSLEGADENVTRAVTGIIKNYLMPSSVEGMSENERRDMAAFGLEEAKYLAENYLDKDKQGNFLAVMETIAKYGLNGSVAGDGKATYNIEKGLNYAGAIDDMDILKEKTPGLYKEINELNQRIISHKDNGKMGFGAEFLNLFKRAQKVLDAVNDKGETNREAAISSYKDWEEKINNTAIPAVFNNTSYTDIASFFESLQNKSHLSGDWLNNNMARFIKWMDF